MELIRGLHNIRAAHRPCVLTLGAFDGVHRGHQCVLQSLRKTSEDLGLPSTVIVFEPLPREYFAPAQAPPRLMSFREKFLALREQGIDRILRVRFNKKLSNAKAEEFIQQVFVTKLGAKFILVGDDLRFGRDRRGDFKLLKAMGLEHGYEVAETETFIDEGQRVSSTRIREALLQARFDDAEKMLGRPYEISGKVVYGQQNGRALGTPTANMELHRIRCALSGVYAVEVRGIDNGAQEFCGVANVGVRPTFGDRIKALLEVHVLNFDGDLYGKTLHVRFRHKLREEKKFAGLDELKKQIHADVDAAYKYFDLVKIVS